MTAASVNAAGPAGPLFEGQVGAHYLLTMLVGGAPRGLPGTTIDRVAFQRAGDHPLDDVIVTAHDGRGSAATIEIQVKRSIRFTASDEVFASVVAQVVEAASRAGFYDRNHELAVATARTNKKAEGPCQDVLKWARELGTADEFFKRLRTKGAANDDHRNFVEAFRGHVGASGGNTADTAIWQLLRRFQILVFDYAALHSANEELAHERGLLLCELIRTAIAVDVEPAPPVPIEAAAGFSWPTGTYVPSGPSWFRLISWLLQNKSAIPAESLADVVAFVLVAVDIVLSHWPNSREAAVPLVACPELLCRERTRLIHQGFEGIDLLGLNPPESDPPGPLSRQALKDRPSRQINLERLVCAYGLGEDEGLRKRLVELLTRASERLGVPDASSNFSDPRFMVVHALNVADPANWIRQEFQREDGSTFEAVAYVPPPEEAEHTRRLLEAHASHFEESSVHSAIFLALDDAKRSSPELAERAVSWAKKQSPSAEDDVLKSRDQDVLAAAYIAIRDGSPEFRASTTEWALNIFEEAGRSKDEHGGFRRRGLSFNPPAIAFAGTAHVLTDDYTQENTERLLRIAVAAPLAAQGLLTTSKRLSDLDERLPRSIIRCAFTASIRSARRSWDSTDEELEGARKVRQAALEAAIGAEIAWLFAGGPEPSWPEFPERRPGTRRGVRLPARGEAATSEEPIEPEFYAEHHGAAPWLGCAVALIGAQHRGWLRQLVGAYLDWTALANGASLDADAEPNELPGEWNAEFFTLVAHTLDGLPTDQIDRLTWQLLATFPDSAFYDSMTTFLRALDVAHFNRDEIAEDAARIRAELAKHLMQSRGWKRLGYDRSRPSTEIHIGAAIATMFFNDRNGFGIPPACYVPAAVFEKTTKFLPTLEELNRSEQTFLQAIVTMNFLLVRPDADQLSFGLNSAVAWSQSFSGNTNFWVDQGIGRRLCEWIEAVAVLSPEAFLPHGQYRQVVDGLLSTLIAVGVPQARSLEEFLLARDP